MLVLLSIKFGKLRRSSLLKVQSRKNCACIFRNYVPAVSEEITDFEISSSSLLLSEFFILAVLPGSTYIFSKHVLNTADVCSCGQLPAACRGEPVPFSPLSSFRVALICLGIAKSWAVNMFSGLTAIFKCCCSPSILIVSKSGR